MIAWDEKSSVGRLYADDTISFAENKMLQMVVDELKFLQGKKLNFDVCWQK